jgi:superfamily I DNA/RNA helicase
MLSLHSLNPQQRLAVETLDGPVLILAGAGTGKTRVITYRIARMIERGIAPGNILAVTFTNKAAREMLERVNQLVPRMQTAANGTKDSARPTSNAKIPGRPTICTFHSLCVRILREHIDKLGYQRNFVIYDESDQLGIIKRILSHIYAKGEKTDPADILAMLSRQRNGGSQAAAFGDPSVAAMARHIRAGYESALRASNAVDFDDLILLTLRLFKQHADALAACGARFRHVMVDEYQDTNAAQFQLVHALTQQHRNLCVVGDDDQSIYGWRGAEIANLLDMEQHFPEVKVIKLEQNYRSTNTILTAANAVIKQNQRRRGKVLWSGKGQGTKITLHTFKDEAEEARTIVEEIDFLRQARRIPWVAQAILFRTNIQSRPLETELRKAGVRYHLVGGQSFFDRREVKDFLAYLKVFLNPNDDMSLLRIANVPARGLSDSTMERLLAAGQERRCSVFAAMKNPVVQATFTAKTRDSIEAFVALIERTRAQLTNGSLALPARTAMEAPPLGKGCCESGKIGVRMPTSAGTSLGSWGRLADVGIRAPEQNGLLQQAPGSRRREEADCNSAPAAPLPYAGCEAVNDAVQTWARQFLAESGYVDELRRSEKDAETAENRIRNLQDLVGSMDEGERQILPPVERLQSFLEDVALDGDREAEKENSGDAVTLITMHSCKGLEFSHVYIVGLEDGLLPHSRAKEEGTLDEERRLFYVAITRAMQSLTISHCAGRMKYGQLTPCQPSPFLKELPAELVEHADDKAKIPVAPDGGKDFFDAMRAAAG